MQSLINSFNMTFDSLCSQCTKFGPPHPCRHHAECFVENPSKPKVGKGYNPELCTICSKWLKESREGDKAAKAAIKQFIKKLRTSISKTKPKNSPPTEFSSIFLHKETGLDILSLLELPVGIPAKNMLSRESSIESSRSPKNPPKRKEMASPRAVVKPIHREHSSQGS